MIFKSILKLTLVTLFLSACSSGSSQSDSPAIYDMSANETIVVDVDYRALKILDLDQMTDLMYGKVNEYKKTNNIQALKEGALIAYSRPDEDGLIDKIMSIVKVPLEDAGEWQNTVQQMVSQSTEAVQNKDGRTKAIQQVTASVVLENILAELRPEFVKQYETGGFETLIVEKIANANLKYTKEALNEKKLNQMRVGLSPSKVAQNLISIKNKKIKEDKEKAEKEASKLPENS